MSAYFALHRYGSPHQEPCRDPMLFDTVLSREGQRKVAALAAAIAKLAPQPDVILVSPLTRCLQTAEAACAPLIERGTAVEVEPLLRERVQLSSEVGRPPQELRHDFPRFRFPDELPDVWWYTEGTDPKALVTEPLDTYRARLALLRQALAARPERTLLLVSHWGVLNELTGLDLKPAELSTQEVEL